MTDPDRHPNFVRAAASLPRGSAVIYRHFGSAERFAHAQALRQICFERQHQFLIGADEELARKTGADGVHLPQRDLAAAPRLRRRYPEWLITGAVHDDCRLKHLHSLDAAFLSPIFASNSPSAGVAIGPARLKDAVKKSGIPIFALGGITLLTAEQLADTGAAGVAAIEALHV